MSIAVNQVSHASLYTTFGVTKHSGAFRLRTSVYLLRTVIRSFAHNSANHLRTFSHLI